MNSAAGGRVRANKSPQANCSKAVWGRVFRWEDESKQSPEACRNRAFREIESGPASTAKVGVEDKANAAQKIKPEKCRLGFQTSPKSNGNRVGFKQGRNVTGLVL